MAYYLKGIGDAATRTNEILPSLDARINNFLCGHTAGVIRSEFNEFSATAIDRGVVIRGGLMQAHGYFGCSDIDTQINFVMPSGTRYVHIYAEIDLSVVPNKFSIASTAISNSSSWSYRQDNLRTNTAGKYQLHLWQVTLTASSIALSDRRTFIAKPLNAVNAELAANATNANQADNATNAATAANALKINDITISRNTSYNTLTVQMPSASTTEFVERKRHLYNNTSGYMIYATSSRGQAFSLSESVSDGDLIELEYKLESFGTEKKTYRARLSGGNSVNIIDFRAGQIKNNGFTAYSWYFTFSGSTMTYSGGYYLLNWANGDGSLLENAQMYLYKVSKVVGSNV
jgi:hypothetical protein